MAERFPSITKLTQSWNVANENFVTLGHLTVNFSKEPGVLPGSIRVDTEEVPDINVGDTIAIQ